MSLAILLRLVLSGDCQAGFWRHGALGGFWLSAPPGLSSGTLALFRLDSCLLASPRRNSGVLADPGLGTGLLSRFRGGVLRSGLHYQSASARWRVSDTARRNKSSTGVLSPLVRFVILDGACQGPRCRHFAAYYQNIYVFDIRRSCANSAPSTSGGLATRKSRASVPVDSHETYNATPRPSPIVRPREEDRATPAILCEARKSLSWIERTFHWRTTRTCDLLRTSG